jgi:hypothetical protein
MHEKGIEMAKVINESTAEGFELGYHHARFVDQEEAKAPLANGLKRCATCAFRQGTYPNGSPTTQMDALKCVMEGVVFDCHEEDHPCVGWALLRRGMEGHHARVAWPFSDELPAPPESKGAGR